MAGSATAIPTSVPVNDEEYERALREVEGEKKKPGPQPGAIKKVSAPKNDSDEAQDEAAAPTLCPCGCGGIVSRGRRFVMGHDAKFHSMVKRVERGELNSADVPQSVNDEIARRREQGIAPHEPLAKKPKAKIKANEVENGDAPTE
jgi:hypothetical protein